MKLLLAKINNLKLTFTLSISASELQPLARKSGSAIFKGEVSVGKLGRR